MGTNAISCFTTRWGSATVFVAVDPRAQECVGMHASRPDTLCYQKALSVAI